jgi:hypothetical protein
VLGSVELPGLRATRNVAASPHGSRNEYARHEACEVGRVGCWKNALMMVEPLRRAGHVKDSKGDTKFSFVNQIQIV